MSKKRKSAKTTTTEEPTDIVRLGEEPDGSNFPVDRAEAHMDDNEILLLRVETQIAWAMQEKKVLFEHLRRGGPRQRELARSDEEDAY